MTEQHITTLNREQVLEIFRRNKGAQTKLAEELAAKTGGNVASYKSAISQVLNGKATSHRIWWAAQAKALKLLEACEDEEMYCQPCPLRPVCEQIAKSAKSKSRKRSHR